MVSELGVVGNEGRERIIADGEQDDLRLAEDRAGWVSQSAMPRDDALAFELEIASHVGGRTPAADQPIGGSVHVGTCPFRSSPCLFVSAGLSRHRR